MKILMCGKGGAGKSTISSLLAKKLSKLGNQVLVIDTDESNFGLHRQLGMNLPQDFTNYFGGKKTTMKRIQEASQPGSIFENKWRISDIPKEYVTKKGNIQLLAIGKIHEANEGCACPMGRLAQQFICNLVTDRDEFVLIDTEAGVEHFGRGVDDGTDMLLMVVDPSFESLKLSGKVVEMSTEIEKPVYFILNKTTEENEIIMREIIQDTERILASVPSNNDVLMAGLKGNEIPENIAAIDKIISFLNK